MPYTRYGPKKSLIRISLLLLFILVCPMVSMGLDITRSTEPNLAVDPGSSFYLTIPLANPESQITGSYVIISDAELKSSVETALAGSGLQIDWPNKKVGYIVRSQEMLRKSWDEQLGELFDAVDAVNLGLNLITLEPPSPTDIVTIFTGTPVDWTIDLGDNYRGTELEGNFKAIKSCMKTDPFTAIDNRGYPYNRYLRDGFLIPPTMNIIIQIPVKAPTDEKDYQIILKIPYYYTSYMVHVPQCAALKITPNQVTWKKTVSVKKGKSEETSSRDSEPTELAGYWRFDEGSGSNVLDTSGNGNTGIISGAKWVNEDRRPLLFFDGNSLVEIKSSPSLDLIDQITIACWIKPDEIQPTNSPTIISKHVGVTPGAQYQIGLGNVGSGFKIRFAAEPVVYLPTTGDMLMDHPLGNSAISMDKWNHLAVTFDGKKITYYLNGAIDREINADKPMTSYAANIAIGAAPYKGWFFKGFINDVRIYNKALSPYEINSLYKSEKRDGQHDEQASQNRSVSAEGNPLAPPPGPR